MMTADLKQDEILVPRRVIALPAPAGAFYYIQSVILTLVNSAIAQ